MADHFNSLGPQKTNNAVIYTRVSTKEQADNRASLATQREACERYARERDLHVVEYFGGTFESAKTDERKEFQKMIAFLKRRSNVSYIIVYSYDRFSRSGTNGAYISEELKKRGTSILSVTQNVDPDSAGGWLQENLYHLFSKLDNQQRKTKCVAGIVTKLREGYWPMHPPLGFTNLNAGKRADLHQIVVDGKGKILRKAWTWKLRYNMRNVEIVKRLKKAGVSITERKLSDTFRNPFYCGKIVCKHIPGEVVQGKHEAMVTESQWLRVYNLLEGNNHKSKHDPDKVDEMPLKVFMRCHDCGNPYTGYLQKQKNIYYYRCRTKGCCKNRNRKIVHAKFAEVLSLFQLNEELKPLVKDMMVHTYFELHREAIGRADKDRARLAELEAKLEALQRKYAFDQIPEAIYSRFAAELEDEMASVRVHVEENDEMSSNLEDCIDFVLTLSCNLQKMWQFGERAQRLKIQNLVFPEGISYDRENNRVLTTRVNSLFAQIPQLTRVLEKDKGDSNENFQMNPLKSG